MESTRIYQPKDRYLVEEFRNQTFIEGNQSLTLKKFDPDNLNGQTLLFFIDENLASISVTEKSTHYTMENDVCRICRYHILKKYRHCNAGFKMLPHHVTWAINNSCKLVYWTHDINNRALNAMYQHKKKMPNKQHFFEDPLYKSFCLQPNLRFVIGKTVQYVYAKYLDENFIWNPKGSMVLI